MTPTVKPPAEDRPSEMEATISSFHLLPKKPPLLSLTTATRNVRISKKVAAAAASEKASGDETIELRVCTNRSCNRQGSRSVLQVLSAIAPPFVSVASCGCLGRCGAGPNLVLLPEGPIIGQCGTPARAARLLAELCGPRFDPQRSLEALALRNKAEDEIEKGNFSHAQLLLSQAIELGPLGGLHFLYKFRSAARLGMGDSEGALKDAEEACRIAPKFPQVK